MSNMSKTSILLIALLLSISIILVQPITVKAATSKTITVPTDYPSISTAIANAANGDTIIVKNGVYVEQTLEINKSLNIISQNVNGAQLTLHPPQVAENLFGQTIMVYTSPIQIDANNVKLSGFSITSDGGDIEANGSQIQMINNVMTGQSSLTVFGDGTQIINNSLDGGRLTLTGSNQTVRENNLENTLGVTGDFNLITNNTSPEIGIAGSHNAVIKNSVVAFQSAVGIELGNGNYNMICDNSIGTGMGAGIAIAYGDAVDFRGMGSGSYNLFAGNIVNGAYLWGILLGNGSYNVFYGNLVENCGGLGHDGFGLAIGGTESRADSNLFFYNAFVNNSKNFGGNWQPVGLNYFDNGSTGNYWDDYLTLYPTAIEVGSLGNGNIPYLVYSGNLDNHPLLGQPDVSDSVPALPSPWSALLSSISIPDGFLTSPISSPVDLAATPTPTATPNIPEFPTLTILLLITTMIASTGFLVYHRSRKQWKTGAVKKGRTSTPPCPYIMC